MWRVGLRFLQKFCAVFGGKGCGLLLELHHLFFVELGRRGCSRGDRYADFLKELFIARRRADADQAGRLGRGVVEAMRGIRWNVCGFACAQNRCLAAEGYLDLSVEHNERLFKVVAMRPGPAPWRDVHVDHAKPVIGVVP